MGQGAASPSPPGWYGKIPSLGDFATRRLPRSFVTAWDAWLQSSLHATRAHAGDAWLERFRNSPLWRFVLTPGVCDATAWAGVIMPSVDRVGRYFPLTIASQIDTPDRGLAALLTGSSWFAALEQAALSTLDLQCSPELLDERLACIAHPPLSSRWSVAESLAARWRDGKPPSFSATFDDADAAAETVLMGAALATTWTSPAATFWWCTSVDADRKTRFQYFRSMPPPERYPPLTA